MIGNRLAQQAVRVAHLLVADLGMPSAGRKGRHAGAAAEEADRRRREDDDGEGNVEQEYSDEGRRCEADHGPVFQRTLADPQSAGLLAISQGLRDVTPDDQQVLRHGFVIYDALYAWAKGRQKEAHNWPPAMSPGLVTR